MADPLTTPILRTAVNKPGTVYNALNTKRMFAEDWNAAGDALDNHEERIVAVEEAGPGGASAFTDLTDAPASYTDQGGKVVAVKSDVSGLEFITPAGGTKCTGAEIDTGTDDVKFATPKAIADSGIAFTSDIPAPLSIATGAEVDTGTDNAKYVTAKAIEDSSYAKTTLIPVKATGAELNTGTDDAKFATAKALADSDYAKTSDIPAVPVKATYTELNTGTDDAKFATAKALADSDYAKTSDIPAVPVKATGAELNTGTDDAKFATAKALADSDYAKTSDIPAPLSIATGAEVDTGTDNAKYVTAKAIEDSSYAKTTLIPVKATGAEVDTGTDDAKFVTAKAIEDSAYAKTTAIPTKATGAEVDTGTDDAKFLTAKSLNDSHNVSDVAPGTSGNVLTSNGTDWTSAAPAGGSTISINTQTTSYTLVLSDAGKLININNADYFELTIPENASVEFPIGTKIIVRQMGVGEIDFVYGGAVVLDSYDGGFYMLGQFAMAILIKVATDTWSLEGNIAN